MEEELLILGNLNIGNLKSDFEDVEELKERVKHRDPFEFMKIDENEFLNTIDGRSACRKCKKSRKFFCYTCYIPTEESESRLPKIKLPLQIDIIKHQKEIDGKSTAVHAAILAPENVRIYTYPDIPDYLSEMNEETTAEELNEPKGHNRATLLKHRLNEVATKDCNVVDRGTFGQYTLDNLPIKRAVFIDSTWNQSRGIFKDPRINRLRKVVLQNRLSQFWRHQKGSPRWFLATIEAIHQFLLENHINAWGLDASYQALDALEVDMKFIKDSQIIHSELTDCDSITTPYNGQYDNLLFFFTHMYHLIHQYYDRNLLKAYRRPIL